MLAGDDVTDGRGAAGNRGAAASASGALNIDEIFDCGLALVQARLEGLGRAPEVHVRRHVDAGNGAVGGAILLGEELAADVFSGVIEEFHAGVAALLGAVMDQAFLANVNVAAAGAAAPIDGQA